MLGDCRHEHLRRGSVRKRDVECDEHAANELIFEIGICGSCRAATRAIDPTASWTCSLRKPRRKVTEDHERSSNGAATRGLQPQLKVNAKLLKYMVTGTVSGCSPNLYRFVR
jgi:hypothetical protein